MYRVSISPKARNQLKKLKQHYKIALARVIEDLKDDPYLGKPLGIDLIGKYSYKVGVFRIIYKINPQDKTIQIITAGHRSTIYN